MSGWFVLVLESAALLGAGCRLEEESVAIQAAPPVHYELESTQKVAMEGRVGDLSHIYLYDPAGKKPTQLTNGVGSCVEPQWSPDGKYITYLRDEDPMVREVWRVSLDGSENRVATAQESSTRTADPERDLQATQRRTWFEAVDWAPDRSAKLVIERHDRLDKEEHDHMFLVDSKGEDTLLTNNVVNSLVRPSWTSNSRYVVGITNTEGRDEGQLLYIAADKTGVHSIGVDFRIQRIALEPAPRPNSML